MKRIFTLITAVLLVCLMAFAITSCGKTEVVIGENGNWFIDGVDSGIKAAGADAEKITIGENGNWFIGAEDTGVKAVSGKYVVDVTTTTELDAKYGTPYAVTVITYSDGTTETQRNEIPVEIYAAYWVSADVYYAGYAPALRIMADYHNHPGKYVTVTDDMFLGEKPDFNTPGTYEVKLVYGGKMITRTVEVLDASNVSVEEVYLAQHNLRKGTPLSDLSAHVFFSDSTSYEVPLSEFDSIEGLDCNTAGAYEITANYGGYTVKDLVVVYDPEVNNIQSTTLGGYDAPVIPYNADAEAVKELFKQSLIGTRHDAYFYETVYGVTSMSFTVTEDMLDLSALDTSMLGRQTVKLTVTIDGIGSRTEIFYVSVEADLSEANLVKAYTNNGMMASMLGVMSIYDNGIAVLDGEGGMQGTYTKEGSLVAITTTGMTMYFSVDDEAGTYEAYVPEGEPTATYLNADAQMQVKVYADYVVLCFYIEADGSTPEMSLPVYAMSSSAIQDNTISFMGNEIRLNDDGTLDMD